jgi:folate-binding protein YgfZ
LSAAGAVEVARGSIDLVRVERGRPLFGVDFDSDCFPQETGLEERAVSYTKGCYLGQEVVARIHYRGGVNRQLRGLRGAIGDDLVVGEKVLREDEAVGAITTAAYSPSVGAPIALAILHRKAEPGAKLRLETGSPVTVVEVPFVVDAVRSN